MLQDSKIMESTNMKATHFAGMENAIERYANAANGPDQNWNRWMQTQRTKYPGDAGCDNRGRLERPELLSIPLGVLFVSQGPGFKLPDILLHLGRHLRAASNRWLCCCGGLAFPCRWVGCPCGSVGFCGPAGFLRPGL